MGLFDNSDLENSKYVSRFVGSALPEIIRTSDKLENNYNQTLDKIDHLQILENSIQSLPNDKSIVSAQIGNTKKRLEDYIKEGNLENADLAIRQAAKDFAGNKELQAVRNNYNKYLESEKYKEEALKQGKQIYLTPNLTTADKFNSVEEDELGNRRFKDFQNPYQLGYNYDDKMKDLIGRIATSTSDELGKAELKKQYGFTDDEINEFRKAFIEKKVVSGISAQKLKRVTDTLLNTYLTSPEGQQDLMTLETNQRPLNNGRTIKEDIQNRFYSIGYPQVGLNENTQLIGIPQRATNDPNKGQSTKNQKTVRVENDSFIETPRTKEVDLNNLVKSIPTGKKQYKDNNKAYSGSSEMKQILNISEEKIPDFNNILSLTNPNLKINTDGTSPNDPEEIKKVLQDRYNKASQISPKFFAYDENEEKYTKDKADYYLRNIKSFQLIDPENPKKIIQGTEFFNDNLKDKEKKDVNLIVSGHYGADNPYIYNVPENDKIYFTEPEKINFNGKEYLISNSESDVRDSQGKIFGSVGAKKELNKLLSAKTTANPIKYQGSTVIYDYNTNLFNFYKGNNLVNSLSEEQINQEFQQYIKSN